MRTQRSARPSRIAAAHRVDLVRCRSRRRLDDRPRGTLAVISLAALAVFRAAAITGRWLPGRAQIEGGQSYVETPAAPTVAAAG